MIKPDGYDDVQGILPGEFRRLPAGGYVCQIAGASTSRSRVGNNMLVLLLDIAEGENAGFFMVDYLERQKKNPEASWPTSGTYWQNTEGNGTKFFKGLMQLVEECNPGYEWDFNEVGLIGKKLGVIFREEEYEGSDGKARMSLKPFTFCTVDAIHNGEFKAPEPKLLSRPPGTEIDEKDIPF